MVIYSCNACKSLCNIVINNCGELKHPRSCINKVKKPSAHFRIVEQG
jgi:hypothetical protein